MSPSSDSPDAGPEPTPIQVLVLELDENSGKNVCQTAARLGLVPTWGRYMTPTDEELSPKICWTNWEDPDKIDEWAINLADFRVALVGNRLGPGNKTGPELVPMLVAAGILCIGISSYSDANELLVAAGAVGGITSKDRPNTFVAELARELMLHRILTGH